MWPNNWSQVWLPRITKRPRKNLVSFLTTRGSARGVNYVDITVFCVKNILEVSLRLGAVDVLACANICNTTQQYHHYVAQTANNTGNVQVSVETKITASFSTYCYHFQPLLPTSTAVTEMGFHCRLFFSTISQTPMQLGSPTCLSQQSTCVSRHHHDFAGAKFYCPDALVKICHVI